MRILCLVYVVWSRRINQSNDITVVVVVVVVVVVQTLIWETRFHGRIFYSLKTCMNWFFTSSKYVLVFTSCCCCDIFPTFSFL